MRKDIIMKQRDMSVMMTCTVCTIAGDVLTDVSVWAGQTLYSAHRVVLALSSAYFRLVLTSPSLQDPR